MGLALMQCRSRATALGRSGFAFFCFFLHEATSAIDFTAKLEERGLLPVEVHPQSASDRT